MAISLQRHREGEINPVPVLAKASTAIAIGDIVQLVSSAATTVGDATFGANTNASVQEGIHDAFIGVSLDQRLANNATSGNILIGTTGVYEFTCLDEAAKDIGTLYGVGLLAGGTNQASMILQSVATANLAVGRLARVKAANATTVWVAIESTITLGGPQSAI